MEYQCLKIIKKDKYFDGQKTKGRYGAAVRDDDNIGWLGNGSSDDGNGCRTTDS